MEKTDIRILLLQLYGKQMARREEQIGRHVGDVKHSSGNPDAARGLKLSLESRLKVLTLYISPVSIFKEVSVTSLLACRQSLTVTLM